MYLQMPTAADVENQLRSMAFWPSGAADDPQVMRAKAQTVIGAAAATAEWETLTGWHPFLRRRVRGLVTATAASAVLAGSAVVDATQTFFTDDLAEGDVLTVGGQTHTVLQVNSNVSATMTVAFSASVGATAVVLSETRELELKVANAGSGVLALNSGILSVPVVTLAGETVATSVYRRMPADAPGRRWPYFWLKFPSSFAQRRQSGLGSVVVNVTAMWGFCSAVPDDVWQAVRDQGVRVALLGVENPRDVSNLAQDGFSIGFDPVGPIDPKTVLANLSKDFPEIVKRFKRPVI